MPIYINLAHQPEDGKPWKHLSPTCTTLLERARSGYELRKVRNPDNKKPPKSWRYRRCPECFEDGSVLADAPKTPPWQNRAVSLEREKRPGTFWVYNICDPEEKTAQVGKAENLATRLQSRWRATLASRFGQDCIPWLYDRLSVDACFEPEMGADPYETEAAALAAERALRDRLESEGWHVSSMV